MEISSESTLVVDWPIHSGEADITFTEKLDKIIRCIVCRLIPTTMIYQCSHGHTFCTNCYQVRVLDKMLGNELYRCPSCRTILVRNNPHRNLIAELIVEYMKVICQDCGKKVLYKYLWEHQIDECVHRPVDCTYESLGCKWRGKDLELNGHIDTCKWPKMTGMELFETLKKRHSDIVAEDKTLKELIQFIRTPYITVRILYYVPITEVLPPPNEYFSMDVFQAFRLDWSVRLMWEVPQRDTEATEATVEKCSVWFRLRLEPTSDCSLKMALAYSFLHGTYSKTEFKINLQKFDFSSDHSESPPALLYSDSYQECKYLLRGIYGRMLLART